MRLKEKSPLLKIDKNHLGNQKPMVMDMGNTHMTKSVKFEVINCENFVMGLNIETHGNSYGKT